MGRRWPLTTLALGRSPFEAPELDENGDFVLGPHAHDFENSDIYLQGFTERGHPQNRASRAATRAMENAQNAVLETIGVVRKTGEEAKAPWYRQSEKDRIRHIIYENDMGIAINAICPFIMNISLWWILSLRRRVQTFRSFSELPLLQVAQSELGILGPRYFFSAGLLTATVPLLLNALRHNLQDGRVAEVFLEVSRPSRQDDTQERKHHLTLKFDTPITDIALFLISMPMEALATLQSLHLIPPASQPNLASLLPFTASSPIKFIPLPTAWSSIAIFQWATSFCCQPLLLAWINEYVGSRLQRCFYRIILLSGVVRPDKPDPLTRKAARQEREDNPSLHGVGINNSAELLQIGRTSEFWQEFKYEFFILSRPISWMRSWKLWRAAQRFSTSTAELPDAVRARSVEIQCQAVRDDIYNLRSNELQRREVQRAAIRRALLEYDMEAWSAHRNIDDYILPLSEIAGSVSTPTPEPIDFFDEGGAQNANEAEATQQSTMFFSSESLRAIADGDDGSPDIWPPYLNSDRRESGSESEPPYRLFPSNPTPPPREVTDRGAYVPTSPRPNEVNSDYSLDSLDLASRRRRVRGETLDWDFADSWQLPPRPEHRVTALSVFPANTVAICASSLITSAVMIPLNSLYLRSLVLGFLGSPADRPGAASAALWIRNDVLELSAWFGDSGSGWIGRARYAGVILLTIGLQGIVSTIVWGAGTRWAISIGRRAGWGQL